MKPERNDSFDIGVEVPVLQGRGTVDLTYFSESLTDEIKYVRTGPLTFRQENQTSKSTRQGIEIDAQIAAAENVDLQISYTYLHARASDGSPVIGRPSQQLALGVTATVFDGRGTVSADLRHVAGHRGIQFFNAFTDAELNSWTTVDVSARYAVTDHVDATLMIKNLLDAKSVDVWGYAGRDRTLYFGLGANW